MGKIFDGTQTSESLEGMPLINDDNYYDDKDYLTNSMLQKLSESPASLKAYMEGEREDNAAFSLGDAVHKGILEPEKFKDIIVWKQEHLPVPSKTLRTSANKAWLEKLKATNKNRLILSEKEHALASDMINSFNNRPYAVEHLEEARYELIGLKEIEGVPMKSKGDIVSNGEVIIDLKTSKDGSIESFKESCLKYGYYRQAAIYCNIFNKTNFTFLVIEKTFPHTVYSYDVSKESLELGWKNAKELIAKWKHYFTGNFEFEKEVFAGVI